MLSYLRRLLAYRRAKPLDYSADEKPYGDWPHVPFRGEDEVRAALHPEAEEAWLDQTRRKAADIRDT